MPATVAAIGKMLLMSGLPSRKTVSAKNISLDKKPLSSGTPAMAAAATVASVAVTGIMVRRPDRRRMSRVPLSWSMMPTAMNSDALNVAWFRMWNTAATAASGLFRPSSKVIKPRCEMVEYASSPLRSFWNMAM